MTATHSLLITLTQFGIWKKAISCIRCHCNQQWQRQFWLGMFPPHLPPHGVQACHCPPVGEQQRAARESLTHSGKASYGEEGGGGGGERNTN